MPRRRHAQGRPGTQVFPSDWQATGAAVIARTFDCLVTVGPPGVTPQWNEAAKKTLSLPATAVYAGPATITPVAQDGDGQAESAQDVIPVADFEVKIHHGCGEVIVGHIVTLASAPDPMLTGRRLQVTGIEKGARRFSRILFVVDAD